MGVAKKKILTKDAVPTIRMQKPEKSKAPTCPRETSLNRERKRASLQND